MSDSPIDATPAPASADEDMRLLARLNLDYLHADQHSDVARYEELLAPEFTASLPDLDYKLFSRREFLDLIAKPRPFTDLQCRDVQITVLGDVALVHARMTLRTLQGEERQGRYTDEYQRRNGRWICIGANVIAQPL